MSKLLTALATFTFASLVLSTPAGAINISTQPEIKEPAPALAHLVIEREQPKEKKEVEKPKAKKVKTYKVKPGDTLSGIAKQYKLDWKKLWSKNKSLKHQDELKIGQKLIIPDSKEKLKERKLVESPKAVRGPKAAPANNGASTPTYTPKTSYRGSGGPNGYAYGWCTWWVKEKRPDIGGYWGNAGYSWISAAQAAGFSTGSTPRPGAIGVQAGHVVYVESVNGSTVNISEMGWGGVANSSANYRSVAASSFTYIY